MGHKPATQPPVLIETGDVALSDETKNSEESVINEDPENCCRKAASVQDSKACRSRSETPVNDDKNPAKEKARKRPRAGNNIEKMEGLVEKTLRIFNIFSTKPW